MSQIRYSDYCTYNGDFIVAEAWIDQWLRFEEFTLELDKALAKARQDAVDCYINLHEG